MISPLSRSGLIRGVLALLLIAALSAGFPAGAEEFPLPLSSASHIQGEFGAYINPVYPALTGPGLSYRQSRYESENASHLFSLNMLGFSFSYAWLDGLYSEGMEQPEPVQAGFYSIGKGFFWGNVFGIGARYSFAKDDSGPYGSYRSWTAGLLLRPASWLSFGYVSRDFNGPEISGVKSPRTDIYSMSLRPFRHYITLSVDMHHPEDAEWRDSVFVYSVDITLGNDISLYGAADNEKNISFGIKVPIDISAPGARSTLIADYYGTTRREGPGLSTFGFSIAGEIFNSPIRTPRQLLKIELKGEMTEIPSQRIMGADRPVYFDVLNAIAAAGDTPGIEGIILTIDSPRMGIARIQEVREELNRFRQKGKKVYAILLTAGNSDYYLATAADRIYFNPAETFTLTGLSAQVYFYRELLDKIGIKFESVRKGRYKFFNEAFTSRVMSRDYRESLIQLLTDLNSQFTGAITSSRNMSSGVLDDMFRRAMITSQEAVDAGFVDVLMYPDPAERDIVRISGGNCRITNLREFIFFPRRPVQWGPVPEIAIIHVGGSIVRGNTDSPGPFSPDATGDETYKKLLGEALSSRSVAGAVIRVNSGGGSAVASDLMRHYLLEIKSRFNKPVVFSFGDIAASGGYYIACTGDGIFASPGTITGSIGVISGKVSLKALYEKIGVNREVVKMAEQSDIFTEARDMTDAEKDIFQKSVEAIYRRFTQVVSEGRKIESAKMDGLAEGRVFTGSQAMTHRLVDSMGGLQAAVEQVLRLTGTTGAYSVKHLPRHKVPLGAELFSTIAAGSTSKLPDSLRKAASRIAEIELLYDRNESALYLYPYKVIIE